MKWNFLANANKQMQIFVQFYAEGLAVSLRDEKGIQNYFLQSDPKNIIIALKEFVTKHHLKHATCHIVLGDQYYRLLLIDKPAVEENELTQAVPWLVKDLIDFPLEQAAIDAFEIPARDEEVSHLYTVITKKNDLIDMQDLLHACQLELGTITILELALQPILKQQMQNDVTTAYIYQREGLIYFLLSSTGIINFVRKIGHLHDFDNVDKANELALELQRSLDYCQTQLHFYLSDGIYFSPGLEKLRDNIEHISVPMQAISECAWGGDNSYCIATVGALKIHEATS